jgi:hypothetical protein
MENYIFRLVRAKHDAIRALTMVGNFPPDQIPGNPGGGLVCRRECGLD